jgi:DNA polymerase III alpha subunit
VSFARYQKGYYTHREQIVEIKSIGIRDTYDIEMVGEPRNFIANGFVSHNSYGFNAAHACLYSSVSFRCAYLKAHYPLEFMAALMEKSGKEARMYKYAGECRRLGIELVPPDINTCEMGFRLVGDKLMAGIGLIKGLGKAIVQEIINNRPYTGLRDLVIKVPRLNETALLLLAKSGAFDQMYPSRKTVHDAIPWVCEHLKKTKKLMGSGQGALDPWVEMSDEVENRMWTDTTDWPDLDRDMMQQTALQIPSANVLIERYKEFIDTLPSWIGKKLMKIEDIDFEESYDTVFIAGSIKPWQINWKIVGLEGGALGDANVKDAGTKYLHANCEDGSDFVLLHISPKQYEANKDWWDRKYLEKVEFPVLVKGTVNPYAGADRKFTKIYVNQLIDIEEFLQKKNQEIPESLNELEQDLLYDDISKVAEYQGDRDRYKGLTIEQVMEQKPGEACVVARVTGMESRRKAVTLSMADESGEEMRVTVWNARTVKFLLDMPARSVIIANLKGELWDGKQRYVLEDYERLGD